MFMSHSLKCVYCLCLFFAISPLCHAASGLMEIGDISHPTIIVSNNGSSYNDARLSNPAQKIAIPMYFELDAGRGSTVADFSFSVSVRHGIGTAHTVGYPQSAVYFFKRFQADEQERRFERTLTRHLDARPLLGHAQDMCNQMAESLRRQGKTDRGIFSRNLTAFFNVRASSSFTTDSGSSTPILSTGNKRVNVRCQRGSENGNRAETGDIPRVKNITARANRLNTNGCKLKLSGSILATAANVPINYKLTLNRRIISSRTYRVLTGSDMRASINHTFTISNDRASTINFNNGIIPKDGTLQIIADGLRSSVAGYSINCILPVIRPSAPVKLPGLITPTLIKDLSNPSTKTPLSKPTKLNKGLSNLPKKTIKKQEPLKKK